MVFPGLLQKGAAERYSMPLAKDTEFPLTPRQMEILALVSKGLSNREICQLLGISANTVKIHVAAILRGLNVSNRTEATFVFRDLLDARQHVAEAAVNGKDPEQLAPGIDDHTLAGARVSASIGRPRIAVLPFTQVGEVAEGDVLSQGLAEDLITRLSAWKWFPVIAYGSSERYRTPDFKREDIVRELGASYLISGSIQQQEKKIRTNVHLLSTKEGQGLWSGSFDLESEDLLHTQQTIANRIVATVAPELIQLEGAIAAQSAQSAQSKEPAYDAWALNCRGMRHLERRTAQEIDQALDCFERAADLMPDFALPWYGMVWAYHHRLWDQLSQDPQADLSALTRAAERCEHAEPRSPYTQIALGLNCMLQGNRAAAISRFQRAVHLNPSAAQAYSLLGQCYGLDGRPEDCIAALEEALELNPLSSAAWIYLGAIALAQFALEDYPEAIRSSERGLAANPGEPSLELTRIAARVCQGEVISAQKLAAELLERKPGFKLADHLALIAPVSREQDLQKFTTALAQAGLTP